MVSTKAKKKRKKKGKDPGVSPMSKYYNMFKRYGIPALVLLIAYLGFRLRDITSNYRTFFDPDTFHHFEMYKIAIHQWIPQYIAYSNPPTGIKAGGYLGLYTVQAAFYKILHPLGYSALGAFKVWPPFVGGMTVIAIYLLGRKIHSDWAGFWAAAFIAFSSANYYKTMSGNNRGEGPFMMFFMFAIFFLMVYLDERRWNWKKTLAAALYLLTSILYMGVWTGSIFGVAILLTFIGAHTVILFTFGKIKELKKFIRDAYPLYAASLLLGLAISYSGFIGIRRFLVFSLEAFAGIVILAAIMFYGERIHLNYSDKKHRFGTVVGIGMAGFVAAYLYFGPDLLRFLGQGSQSNPLYQTVAELAKTHWINIKESFGVRGKDGVMFIISVAGFLIVFVRFIRKLIRNDLTGYKEVFLVTYYMASMYLLYTAVRFTFQASGAVMLLAGVAVGEAFLFVENMRESTSTKTLYAVLLILLFIPLPIASANYLDNLAQSYSRSGGTVPSDWVNTLDWLKTHSNPLDSATSWWDYGYWIESSLLSHRRSATDGGYAYDRRYIVADFFSHSGNAAEEDFEAWELNYVITFMDPLYRGSDFWKFNAISYLGGAITYGEYHNTSMLLVVSKESIKYVNESGKEAIYIVNGKYGFQPKMVIDLTNGKIIHERGDIPYVLYIFNGYGVLAYYKIAFSDYVMLGFHIPYSVQPWSAQKLFANFQLVHGSGYVLTYKFHPFAIYRMDQMVNGTWQPFYSTLGGGKLPKGNQKLRLWISAFGRNVKNATLVFEAYNGTKLVEKKVLKKNLYINHLNETPVEVSLFVPNATSYRFLLIQKGPVGVLNGPVYVNGKNTNPSYVLGEGQSGNLKLTAAFRKAYSNVEMTLRASVIYYVTPHGNDIYKKDFYLDPHMDIVTYIPVKKLSVKAGNNTITASASVPDGVFEKFVQGLYKKYGKDKVVVYRERIEPIFITEKTYSLWEGS